MAREVTIKSWCDICLRESDQRVDAVWTQPIALGGPAKNLDLCAGHAEDLLAPLERALHSYGVEVGAKPPIHQRSRPGKGEHPCPACGKEYTYRNSLTSHTLRVHGKQLAELEGEVGLVPPAKAEGYPCGYVGDDGESCDYVARNAQGRGAHKRAAHGIAGSSPAVLSARRRAEEEAAQPPIAV